MAQLAISVNGRATVTGCGSLIVSHSVSGTDGGRTISSVVWNLGTGNTPNGNPVNDVYGPGIYNVSVTVNYTTGAPESTTANNAIEVFESPAPSFDTSAPGGCAPTTITFTNTTPFVSGATSWQTIQWEFSEDGSIIGNTSGSPANFTFTDAGTYDVKLLVRDNNGCASTVNFVDQIVVIDDLVANFTPSTTQTTCAPNLNVNFTNTTTTSAAGSISYLWDFGDGATSTAENPSHNFTGPGVYSVSLTATHDASSCSDVEVKNQLIRVLEEDLGFQGNPLTGCTPFIVNFSDTSRFYSGAGQTDPVTVNGLTYTWDFGDGTIVSGTNQRTPSHTYTTPGNYTVTMTITGGDGTCTGTVTKNNYITVPPEVIARFAPDQLVFCENPFTVNFTDASVNAVTYAWDFDDGTGIDNTNGDVSHTFNNYGTFDVTLTVEDALGCADDTTVTIQSQPLLPAFNATETEGCVPDFVTDFNNLSTALVGIDSSCWTITNLAGDTVFSADLAGTGAPQDVALPDADTYTVSLTVKSDEGCEETLTIPAFIQVGIRPIDLAFTPSDTIICPLTTVDFDNQSTLDPTNPFPVNWTWDYEYISGQQPAIDADGNGQWLYQDRDSGFVDVALFYESNGCLDTLIRQNLILYLGPNAEIGSVLDGCNPDSVFLTNNSTGTFHRFEWLVTQGATIIDSTTQINNPAFALQAGQTYDIQLTIFNDTTTCSDVENITVVMPDPLPAIDISASDTVVCVDEEIQFGTTVANPDRIRFRWDFGDGETATNRNPTHAYLNSGTYTVSLEIDIGDDRCTIDTAISIRVTAPDARPAADITEGCIPLTVNFSDTTAFSNGFISRIWRIDGDSITDNANFTYEFDESKTPQSVPYTVSLTIADTNGCTVTRAIPIQATRPNPDFTIDSTRFCKEFQLTFRAPNPTTVDSVGFGLNAGSYEWSTTTPDINFDISGNGRRARSNFPDGTHTVQLKITDDLGCMDSISKTFDVNFGDTLTADFGADPITADCPPQDVTFTDSSTIGQAPITTWSWTFGDGSTSGLQNPVKIYDTPGDYTVSLAVMDALGCTDTLTRVDLIKINGPFATAVVDDTVGYVDFNVNFNSLDKTLTDSILWTPGDGTVSNYDIDAPYNYTYTIPGEYRANFRLKDTLGCEWSPPVSPLTVYALPCPTLDIGSA